MIGEKIGEETSITTGRRVVGTDGAPSLETSGTGHGTLLGVKYKAFITYTGTLRPDGTIAGQGKGLVMGMGGEMATHTGTGVGRMNDNGGVSWRGVFCFQSAHPAWSRLNGTPTPFEYELDANGDGKGVFYDWK